MSQPQDPKSKQQAFLALYEPVHAPFARFCQARVFHSADAKDLISETVLQAYEHFDSLRHKEAFLHFLFGIASRLLRNKSRRRKFWGIFNSEEAEEKQTVSDNAELDTDVRLLYEALAKLPEEQREAIILFEISGFALKEVQEIQGCSLSAVKSRVVRGKKRLARLLNDQETLRLLESEPTEEAQFEKISPRTQVSLTF
ncbi:RNA polymerase sigma factor [Rufibacter aurantiacus]|uniref:RNA polymerase sigma factor n=1 Tax=Rufibacter aurantiacus TaxID=2817374 RepID=UPI001B314328|nr:RNA polymerase sigma factor [Rufibacter aurantiacus]